MAPVKSKTHSRKSPNKPKKAVVEIGKEVDDDNKPGCIYLGHIPHGFYESQMKKYFSQFGKVMEVKVCRSKKTQNSKGFGFVKFRYSAVAKTVAETCHNYLFLNKLLKCEYKPMSEMHKDTFKKTYRSGVSLPKSKQNNARTEKQVALSTKKSISKATGKLKRLKSSGLDVDISDVMNVPDVSKINSVISGEVQKEVKTTTEEATLEPVKKRRKTEPSSSSVDPQPKLSKSPKTLTVSTKGNKSPVVSTPKSASKKVNKAKAESQSPAISTSKSASKKMDETKAVTKSPAMLTPKLASKKMDKSSSVSMPRSASKKMEKTPKSASKNMEKTIKVKENKTPTPKVDTLSRKRKRSLN